MYYCKITADELMKTGMGAQVQVVGTFQEDGHLIEPMAKHNES